MFTPKTVSQLIRMFLVENEMSRADLAKKIDLSHVTLCNIINNKTPLTKYTLRKLQLVFDRDQNEALKSFYIKDQTLKFEEDLRKNIR